MTADRSLPDEPLWMNDARVRRMIADSIRRRRAKRKLELAKFEQAVQAAERMATKKRSGQKA